MMLPLQGQLLAQSVVSSAIPSNSTPANGDQITVAINIDMTGMTAPDTALGSFTGTINWDTSVLSYASNSGILSGFVGNVNVNAPAGMITFNGINAFGVTGAFDVLNVTFDVIGASGSSSTLDLAYSAMAAALTFNNLLPFLTVNDGTVTVAASNDPPVIDPIANQAVNEGSTLDVAVSSTDINGDNITLSTVNLPSFGSLHDNGDGTGLITFTPGFSDMGSYTGIEVIATDDGSPALSDTATFDLTVNDATPPAKLLLSELTVRPTSGEFVEIYNPGATPVDLTNYYLTDATFQSGGTFYYQIVEGGGGGGSFADWHARFPAGATIAPGEYQTVAMNGAGFLTTYGIAPTYELFDTDPTITDMLEAFPGSINGQGGFTNSDEVCILYYWNGVNDLVGDVDYVIYDDGGNSINEQVDKTGVLIDGPDVNTDSSGYLPDTPILSQVPAPVNNTADGFSTHRIDFTEGTQTTSGGNGVTGADETSEDLNNTWTDNSVPSPNGPWTPVPVPAPMITFSPDSMSFTLGPSESDSATLTITNTGGDTLNVTLDDEDVTVAMKRRIRPQYHRYPANYYGQDLGKGEADFRQGNSPNDGLGGPDAFGHTWIDSDEPNGPVFNWVDITGTGTPVSLSDDDFIEVTLPFTFSFYGIDHTLVKIGSNGYLTFGPDGTDFSNDPIPDPLDPNDLIAPFWDDLNPADGGTIHYEGAADHFTVQYTDIPHFGGGGVYTFQATLFSNGTILYQYLTMTGTLNSATIGIEDPTAADGLEVIFNAPYVHDNLAVLIKSDSPWLSENPTAGSIPPGGSADFQVIANSTGLLGGDYHANVLMMSNDPVHPDTSMRVNLTVTGVPGIGVTPDPLVFPDPVFVGQSETRDLTVSNSGNTDLVVSNITSSVPDFVPSPTSFTVPAGGSSLVSVTFTPAAAGMVSGSLSIVSNDPSSPTPVGVQGDGILPPEISVSPDSINQQLPPNDSTDVTVAISNVAPAGAASLEWSARIAAVAAARPVIPPASDNYPRGIYPPSAGAAPRDGHPAPGVTPPASPLVNPNVGYGIESSNAMFDRLNLATPEVLNAIAGQTGTGGFSGAGGFGGTDQSFAYQLDTDNYFAQIDTATGAATVLPSPPAPNAETWSGLETDPTTGLLYGLSTNVATSTLSIIDPATGAVTVIGQTGMAGGIALAIDGNGDMWSYDIVSDQFFSVDKNTGVATVVGPLGFDANFGQGMAWDPESDQVYMAAFNNGAFQPELRIVDTSTGSSTLVGVIGSSVPGGLTQLGWMGIPGAGGLDFIELIGATSGTIAPGDLQNLTVRLRSLNVPDTSYHAEIEISSNDPTDPIVVIPVWIEVGPIVGIGGLGELPTTFEVSRNYPNPFNPSTTINYQLPRASDVKLVIYNMLGQRVRTLVNQRMEAGFFKSVWNGLNDAGQSVASGIYIYRFEAGDFLKVQKMILLK